MQMGSEIVVMHSKYVAVSITAFVLHSQCQHFGHASVNDDMAAQAAHNFKFRTAAPNR